MNDSEQGSLAKETRDNLTNVSQWLHVSRVYNTLCPDGADSRYAGICSQNSASHILTASDAFWPSCFRGYHQIPFVFQHLVFTSQTIGFGTVMSFWVGSALIQMTWGLLVSEVYCFCKPPPGFCARWSLKTWILSGTCKHFLCLGHWAERCLVWQGHLAAPPSIQ